MPRRPTLLILAAVLILSPHRLPAVLEPAGADTSHRVFFSAVDAKGAAVTDLVASDLTVKEGGRDRVVATLRPATGRLQVSILVDDGGDGLFQGSVSHFINRTFGQAEFTISMLNPQPLTLVEQTTDAAALRAAVNKMTQRGRIQRDGLQLIEAVSWAARELRRREAPRPVIIAITNGGEPGISDEADSILADLRASGASLHVVHANGVGLGKVFYEGPRSSGGTQSNAASTQAVTDALSRIATGLLSQYELIYIRPDGTRPGDRLEVKTTRRGVTLLAPQRRPTE